MSTETMIAYWIGEEPTPPSPTLQAMPAYVDVAPLAFVNIHDKTYKLDFSFLCKTHMATVIATWIRIVRANGTKVLLSINDQKLGTVPDVGAFVEEVAGAALQWGVDGIDLDFEPPYKSQTLLQVTSALRPALRRVLGREPLLAAPIYEPWADMPDFLKAFASKLDFLTTMDYSPYHGFDDTTSLFEQYASITGTPEKIAVGVSCMGPPPPPSPAYFTPLDDVVKLCQWEPQGGRKKGVMLYTFSYDVKTRKGSGTGYPNGTFTKTIHENLL